MRKCCGHFNGKQLLVAGFTPVTWTKKCDTTQCSTSQRMGICKHRCTSFCKTQWSTQRSTGSRGDFFLQQVDVKQKEIHTQYGADRDMGGLEAYAHSILDNVILQMHTLK